MSAKKPGSDRQGQWLKNIGLSCLFTGFALEMGAMALNRQFLLESGLAVFLLGIPLLLLGIFISRRSR